MADRFKTLHLGDLADSIETIYTVPVAKQAIIKHIRAVNTGAVPASFELFQNGDLAANQILPPVDIASQGYWKTDSGFNLEAGDTLRARASAAGQITLVVYGLEVDDVAEVYYTQSQIDTLLADKADDAHAHIVGEIHSWTPMGEIKVPSGDADYLNPMFALLRPGETLVLKRVRARINSGASVTLKFQKNGVDVTGYTGLSVTTAAADIGVGDVSLANNDLFVPVVTAVSGTPKNMTLTALFERTTA